MSISLDDQIACARREVGLRASVYPRLVAQGKMTQAWADFQLTAMQAIVATLEALQHSHAQQSLLLASRRE